MSDTSQGPGWWQASDGRWYAPEQHPNYTPAPSTGVAAPASPPPRYAGRTPPTTVNPAGGYPQTGYPPTGYPPTGYPPTGYPPTGFPAGGYAGGMYPGAPPRSTNGLAIASFVLSLLWILGVGAVLAVIFGIIARKQIRASQGGQGGDGLAIAGLIIGSLGLIGSIAIWSLVAVAAHNPSALFNFPTLQCQADAKSVETGLQAFKAVNGSYPSPPEQWSQDTYATNFIPLTTSVDRGPFLTNLPNTNFYVIEYDSFGHVWVEGAGIYDSSFNPTKDFDTFPSACNAA